LTIIPSSGASAGKKWNLTTVDKTGPTGWFTSLAIDKKGTPIIAYWSQLEKNPKFAVATDTGWRISSVDHSRVLGRSASLAISKSGQVAIASSDDTDLGSPMLKYSIQDGELWKTSLVDLNVGGGYQISLAFTTEGMPAISYYDLSKRRLKFAELVQLKRP